MTPSPHDLDTLRRTWSPPSSLLGRIVAPTNSRIIGVRFMVTAAAFFVLAGIMALLMRTQLAVPENDFLDPELFNELFTMHGSTMMFLFIVPFIEGLAMYVLPLMVGARDLAFTRLSSFGYWIYLAGGLLFFASFLAGSVPDAGWFSYTPLSGKPFSPGLGQDFWLLGLSLTELSGITSGVELIVTSLRLRAPGMSLTRMPLFVWAILVTAWAIVLAFTVLFVATMLLELERTFGFLFFDPSGGGSPLLWQHLFWIFGHPEVYIMFIPATGIVSTVVATAAKRPIVPYRLVVLALVVTGFVSFGLWVHHMFASGLPELATAFFTATSFVIALATGTQFFAWIATLWGTRPRITTPMLYVIGFVIIFMIGGVTGVMVAAVSFDLQVHDTYFVVAHFHYVLIGGVVFPLLGAMYYWLPKITGRMLNERLGRWGFALAFVGFNVAFFPMHVSGLRGMPRRVYTYAEGSGLSGTNLLSTLGAYVLALGVLVFVIDAIVSLRRGRRAEDDPWSAGTLEWAVPSPPPSYGVLTPAVVQGLEPLWEAGRRPEAHEASLREAAEAMDARPTDWRATMVTSTLTGQPQGALRLSGPSFAPFLTALGVVMGAVAVLIKVPWLGLAGLALAAVALSAGWLWPSARQRDEVRRAETLLADVVPDAGLGNRSVAAWGVGLAATVAGVAYLSLLFSYLYLAGRSDAWPQDGLAAPGWVLPTTATLVLALGAACVAIAVRAETRRRTLGTSLGLAGGALAGLVFVGLQLYDLVTLPFAPQANAYASSHVALLGFTAAWAFVASMLLLGTLLRWALGHVRPESHAVRHAGVPYIVASAAALVALLTVQVVPRL